MNYLTGKCRTCKHKNEMQEILDDEIIKGQTCSMCVHNFYYSDLYEVEECVK